MATEFDIQGLELDWVCVTWNADFRFSEKGGNIGLLLATDGIKSKNLKDKYI